MCWYRSSMLSHRDLRAPRARLPEGIKRQSWAHTASTSRLALGLLAGPEVSPTRQLWTMDKNNDRYEQDNGQHYIEQLVCTSGICMMEV